MKRGAAVFNLIPLADSSFIPFTKSNEADNGATQITSLIAFGERSLNRSRWLYRQQCAMGLASFSVMIGTAVSLASALASETVSSQSVGLATGGFAFTLIGVWMWSPWKRAKESFILISAFEGLHLGFLIQIAEAERIEDPVKRRNRLAKIVREHVDQILSLPNPRFRHANVWRAQ